MSETTRMVLCPWSAVVADAVLREAAIMHGDTEAERASWRNGWWRWWCRRKLQPRTTVDAICAVVAHAGRAIRVVVAVVANVIIGMLA